MLAAAAFGLVYLHVVLAQRQFGLDVLSKKVTAEAQQYQRLRLQVARLEAPARIIAAAEGQLGMREPASVTYLAPSGPAPAAPVTAPGSATTSGTEKVAGGGPAAPAGDADWPVVKSLLAGSP